MGYQPTWGDWIVLAVVFAVLFGLAINWPRG